MSYRPAAYVVRSGEHLTGDGFQLVTTDEEGAFDTDEAVALAPGEPLNELAAALFGVAAPMVLREVSAGRHSGAHCVEVPRSPAFRAQLVSSLLAEGQLHQGGEAEYRPAGPLPEGPWACFDNARRLAWKPGARLCVGLGLHSLDGWTLHSWVHEGNGTLVEPTARPLAYFGFAVPEGMTGLLIRSCWSEALSPARV